MGGHCAHKRQGQAATELAIFGAVLIFLMGGIVRSAVSASYQQNQQLKALRQALLTSYSGTQAGAVEHNSAAVLYIEDRLSPDLNKFGPQDRIPFVTQGSGTMSNMLMFPLDLVDLHAGNIPVMDVLINGLHFTFTTAALSGKAIGPPTGYSTAYTDPPAGPNGNYHYGGWNFKCIDAGGTWYGCPIFYQLVANAAASGEAGGGGVGFSSNSNGTGSSDFCAADPCPGILSAAERFDLNRDDDFTNDPQPTATTGKPARADMAWQWKGTNGLQSNINIDVTNGNYPSYDVDNDRQEETLYAVSSDGNGVVTGATVLDFQDGDIDLSHDNKQPGLRPGLQNDMAIYTRTNDGTYLQIKEGKLYNPETGSFVRSASKMNQVEIVQRIFQLSHNTGNFCDGAGGAHGPVELCSEDCFLGDNIKLTCYDTKANRIYIRSRLLDKRGHFWKTNIEGTTTP